MSETLTITLPLPPKECSPNWRGHWARRAKAVKMYRFEAYCAAGHAFAKAGLQPFKREPVREASAQLTFYWPDKRRRDRDNALSRMKSAFDGLTDAGVWTDDSGVTHLPVVFAVDREKPRVEIAITEDNP